jgi:hypothetical protein
MQIEKYRAGISELYQGEVTGEGLFSEWLARCAPEHAYGMALLLQLESEAKARLRPLLWRLGLPLVEDPAMRTAGVEEAQRLARMPWHESMLGLAALVKPYLARYRALAAAAPAQDKPEVHFMVTHEMTVLRFAECQAAGDANAALWQLLGALEHPWPPERSPPSVG